MTEEPMRGSWNDLKRRVADNGGDAEKLAVEILDCWMDDYLHDGDWWFGPDERESMTADVMRFRKMLGTMVDPDGWAGSGGGKF